MRNEGRRMGLQVAVGVLVMLLPVLGFPFGWEAAAQYLAGAAIIALALPFSMLDTCRAILTRRPGTCPTPAPAAPRPNHGEAPHA